MCFDLKKKNKYVLLGKNKTSQLLNKAWYGHESIFDRAAISNRLIFGLGRIGQLFMKMAKGYAHKNKLVTVSPCRWFEVNLLWSINIGRSIELLLLINYEFDIEKFIIKTNVINIKFRKISTLRVHSVKIIICWFLFTELPKIRKKYVLI